MTQPTRPPTIETAELDWQNDQPVSRQFGDVYFNRDNGLEETRYVFLHHNALADRFAKVPKGGHVVVAETGFGSGLNFLAAWQLWRQEAPSHRACLHFVSAEGYPLRREDLRRALALWPELSPLSEELIAAYPEPIQGTHRLVLDQGRVRLTLHFGEVLQALHDLEFQADAWFLDGFAPSKNPDMWQQRVIDAIAEHSGPGTTLATFTAAGSVRRGFDEAGFDMSKVPGFGCKREMLVGRYHASTTQTEKPVQFGRVGIVGAGIAGAALARNLADRGIPVTLIDKSQAADGASGNSQGALYVKLGVDFNDQTALALHALLFSQRFYSQLADAGWHPSGLIQLAYNDTERDRQARFLAKNQYPGSVVRPVDASTASELAQLNVPHGGLWFPDSGWLEPAAVCQHLLNHPDITTSFGYSVQALERTDKGWRAVPDEGVPLEFDQIVLCTGADTPTLIPGGGHYRLKTIRGQITEVPDSIIDAPSVVLCGPGYVNPAHGHRALVGATFDLHNSSVAPSPESDRENLAMLSSLIPAAIKAPENEYSQDSVRSRVAFRCTTHDYQPIAGPMKDREGRPMPGLSVLSGLGSKGLTYSTLLAEYLADRISGQPACMPENLSRRVDTQRIHRPEPKGDSFTAENAQSVVKP